MPSVPFFLVVLAGTGILLKGTSAIPLVSMIQAVLLHSQVPVRQNSVITRDLWREAIKAFGNKTYNVRFNLAPTFGSLNSAALQQLDESLRVMIGGILEIDIKTDYSWNEIMQLLNMNFYLKRQSRFSIKKIERINFTASRLFGAEINTSKRMGPEKVLQLRVRVDLGVMVMKGQSVNLTTKTLNARLINTWFNNLIGSPDILKDTEIDLDALVELVSSVSGYMLQNINTMQTKKISLYDLGILRFPDIRKPYFSVYRINLIGRCHHRTHIIRQDNRCEVLGLFQRERFLPDRKYIRSLNRRMITMLLEEVDDLFADI